MQEILKKTIIKAIIAIIVSSMLFIAFLIPFGMFPALGDFLFPGNGLWTIPDSVPESERLVYPQLSADVTVLRDEWGIPHIYGSNESDLLFALGYLHAQDRLFQMDLARRLTQGKLSEVLGPEMVEFDKFNLRMLKDYWTKQTVQFLRQSNDPVDQEIMQKLRAYIQGINFYISHCSALPLEFQFLAYEPTEWTIEDSLGFIKYMSEMLTWSYSDFTIFSISDAIGEEGCLNLYSRLPYQIPICPNYGEFEDIHTNATIKSANSFSFMASATKSSLKSFFSDFMTFIQSLPGERQRIRNQFLVGSNNWVIDGSKSESGFPILCNDMHLAHTLPGIWYEAHLVNTGPVADFNVYGFFLAGVPYPIVGHNSFVGWGMTNAGFDVIDWYYYNGINETHYWYNGKALAYKLINYSLTVKNAPEHPFSIKNTVHGPVFDSTDITNLPANYSNLVLACKWIAQNITREYRAIYEFSHAQNRTAFNEASRYFDTPAQNIVYADIAGNIAIRPTGKVPIRNDSNIPSWHLGNGTMPYNGTAGRGEWTAYLPFDLLPYCENPAQGYLTSANQIIAGPDYLKNYSLQTPIYIANGYRARRINNFLSTSNSISLVDMKRLQTDVYSIKAERFISPLLTAIGQLENLSILQSTAVSILENWNYHMDKDLVAPTIFNVWLEIYTDETFSDEMDCYGCLRYPHTTVLEKMTHTDFFTDWFDNINTVQIEDREEIMLLAFNKTLSALEHFFKDKEIANWLWGEINYVSFPHLAGISSLSKGPYSINGSRNTLAPIFMEDIWVNDQVQKSLGGGGASERLIIDFSNLNNSLSIIPSGQRGISHSEHYSDQLLMYLRGEYHPQYFGAETIEDFQSAWIESVLIIKTGGS